MCLCPSREQLERYLVEALLASEREQIETHVEKCQSCQESLDQLTSALHQSQLSLLDSQYVDASGSKFARAGVEGSASSTFEPAESFLRLLKNREPASSEIPNIDGYEVLGTLGQGGMGVVYKARQKSLNRVVALKMIMDSSRADSDGLARFRGEADALARFQHPNIVQVYEFGEHSGRPYLVLEYVEGPNLSDFLRSQPLSARQAAQLVETLADTIHAAHERGVIHRDLKPGNVLLKGSGIRDQERLRVAGTIPTSLIPDP